MALRSSQGTPQDKMLQSIDSIVQFKDGEKAKWNNVAIPIPKGMVIISTDTLELKIGDGEKLYKELPVLFSLQILEDMAEQIEELSRKVAAETSVTDHGNITGEQFQFRLEDGYAHKANLDTHSLMLMKPILPEGVESGKATCLLTCTVSDTLINFGPDTVFMGTDGRILLENQSYLYTFSVIGSKAYVETRLIPSTIR